MIDNPNDAFAQCEAQARLRAELAREVTPLNKATLFAVLQAAGIQCVIVHFDGAGDAGIDRVVPLTLVGERRAATVQCADQGLKALHLATESQLCALRYPLFCARSAIFPHMLHFGLS
jgi:hypothetical protein